MLLYATERPVGEYATLTTIGPKSNIALEVNRGLVFSKHQNTVREIMLKN